MKNFLSKEEKEILKSQHKKERDKRVCDRIKAVLLYDEGWNYQEIAHVLLLSDEGVRKHIQDYQLSQKLNPENGGSESKLNRDLEARELLIRIAAMLFKMIRVKPQAQGQAQSQAKPTLQLN